ncbi:energy-coupling factor ABC transporter permease [Bradyrhizobium sp. ISRA443]|uniref:energy-coupling factor ABC transporter permease n=1 Tax=unclassified Bradyrhizobium TaxID=2631580 RepID=UPI002478728F|nr:MULTISPECIES: energy-coupling factor ABC transporter permease [unclassified Bradyrhizobium]WGR93264.1 energy-coupling factor ABC transporter permease [Bradyrhizobium sp. ISRA435]WGR97790.1 energy-coupling factor ABC transporter permease [Bradyrhizobium sp. ISRA436]WGS04679.1 energy-coupling factor ABC transporter permease [Bradyrhizobium sp. ISRA437]WGS11560.1 energy-coupling factor ABC transporter permease [Bradyrhizobium sp. ISRA443]
MHIEPGLVTGTKLVLGYATGMAVGGVALKLAVETVREKGIASFLVRTGVATALVFTFFEILPHYPVGVSEVHFILGSTLFLLFGAAPAALGLALGLLVQGLCFVPTDLPQYGMNVTTLLVPLLAIQALAQRIISRNTAYVDLRYSQTLALSTAYQSGIVAWVAFWALYGAGFGAANLSNIVTFAASYAIVIVIEPFADLAVLATAKAVRDLTADALVTTRLHNSG